MRDQDEQNSILRLRQGIYGDDGIERRECDRRQPEPEPVPEPTNGSISWKGIRMPALIGLLLAAGGGTAYVKAREPAHDLAPQVQELRARTTFLEEAVRSMSSDLKYLVQAEAKRQGREEVVGRRR